MADDYPNEDDDTLDACCDHCGSLEHASEDCPDKP